MPSQLLLAEKRAAFDSVATLAQRDLVELWRGLDLQGDPGVVTNALLAEVPSITTTYGDIAADIAVDFYDEIRSAARIRSRFGATPARVAPADRVSAFVRHAVTPMWSATPDPTTTLQNLSGGITRLSLNPGRETTIAAAERDPAKPRLVRVAEPRACSFCLMLVSRGAVYDFRFPAHDHCRCDAVQIYDGDSLPPESERLAAEWAEVTAGAPNAKAARAEWDRHIESQRS